MNLPRPLNRTTLSKAELRRMIDDIDAQVEVMRRDISRLTAQRRSHEEAMRRLHEDNSFQSLFWPDDAIR